MMQPGMMQPVMMQPMMMVQQIIYVPLGLAKMSAEGIFVKQKFLLLQALTGCEQQNEYQIFNLDRNGEKRGTPIYKAKEKSTWCARNCLQADCRPFKMLVSEKDYLNPDGDETPVLKFNRECRCTFYCFNRPELTIEHFIQGQEVYIGKIRQPWMCMNLQVNVHDESDALKYKVNGSCCQLGIWCHWPCEPCQTVDFDVYDAGGEKVGSLQKRTAGCLKSAISDTANFATFFPANATPNDKALLLAAIIMLDFSYFEEKPQNGDSLNAGF
jgi:hypothetical protein